MQRIRQCDSIGYIGNVSIKTYDIQTHKSKLYNGHNKGQIGLFTFITQALQGGIDSDMRPSKINLYSYDSSTSIETQLLSYSIAYTTVPQITKSGTVTVGTDQITYQFTIPGSAFTNQSGTINRLKLFNNSTDSDVSLCALIDLTTAISFTSTTNVIVEWTLKFVSE